MDVIMTITLRQKSTHGTDFNLVAVKIVFGERGKQKYYLRLDYGVDIGVWRTVHCGGPGGSLRTASAASSTRSRRFEGM